MRRTVFSCLLYIQLVLLDISLASKTAVNQTKKVDKMLPKNPVKRPRCDFFRFETLSSPNIAVVEAQIQNKNKVNETYKIVLNCPTLKILDEPKMTYTLKPGGKELIIYKLIVNNKEIHRTPEVIKHKCVLTKWSERSNKLAMCHFDVSVWPYGLFDYACDDYKEGQVKFMQKPEQNKVVAFKVEDSTTKVGLFSLYMMNLTCSPRLPVIEGIERINKLRKEKPWFIEVPANCSAMLRQNYVGTCNLEIFNLCHTQTVVAVNTSFQLYDGETDECEYLKERLGDLSQHPLAEFFGLNYVETGYLTVVVLTELFVICLTGLIIFVRIRQNKKIE